MTTETMTTALTAGEARAIRATAGMSVGRGHHYPVRIVAGAGAPSDRGGTWHYETMGGKMICHPSAYRRAGWSNMRYVGSTRRVEVGADWLARWRRAGGEHEPAAAALATLMCEHRCSLSSAWRRWEADARHAVTAAARSAVEAARASAHAASLSLSVALTDAVAAAQSLALARSLS